MTTKTKDKLSKALKNKFLGEMKDQKEIERLERVKINSSLREIIVYINGTNKLSDDIINFLTKEGVNLITKEVSENQMEWNKIDSIINMQSFPTFYVNGEYLTNGRDFQNGNQILNALKYLGDPNFDNPPAGEKSLEYSKTIAYNLFTRLTNLENKLTPLIQFIENLQKELIEEESE